MFKLPKLFLLFTLISGILNTRNSPQIPLIRNQRDYLNNRQNDLRVDGKGYGGYGHVLRNGKGYGGNENYHALRNGKDYVTPTSYPKGDHVLRNGKTYNFNTHQKPVYKPSIFNPARKNENPKVTTDQHVLRNGKSYGGLYDNKKFVSKPFKQAHGQDPLRNYNPNVVKKPVSNKEYIYPTGQHVLRNGKTYGNNDYKKPVSKPVKNEILPVSKVVNNYPTGHHALRNGKTYGFNDYKPLSKPVNDDNHYLRNGKYYPPSYPLRMKRVHEYLPKKQQKDDKKDIKKSIKTKKSFSPIKFIKNVIPTFNNPFGKKVVKTVDSLKIYNFYLKDILEGKSTFWKQKVEISSTRVTVYVLLAALANTLKDNLTPLEDTDIKEIEHFLKRWYAFTQSAIVIHRSEGTFLTYSQALYRNFSVALRTFISYVDTVNKKDPFSSLYTNLVFTELKKVQDIYNSKLTWNDGGNAIGEIIDKKIEVQPVPENRSKLVTLLEKFSKPMEKFNYSIIFSLISHTSYYVKKYYILIGNNSIFVNLYLELLQSYKKMIKNTKYIEDGQKVGLKIPGSVIRYHFLDVNDTLKKTTYLKNFLLLNKNSSIHFLNLIIRINSLELNLKNLTLYKNYVYEYHSNNSQYISRNLKNTTNNNYTPLRIRNNSGLHSLHKKKEFTDHKNIIIELKEKISMNAINSHFANLILNFIRLFDIYYVQNQKIYSINFYYIKFLELCLSIFSNMKQANNSLTRVIQYRYVKVDIYQLRVWLRLIISTVNRSFSDKNSSTLILIKEGEAIDNVITSYKKEKDDVLEIIKVKKNDTIKDRADDDKVIDLKDTELGNVNQLINISLKFIDTTSTDENFNKMKFTFRRIFLITSMNKNNKRISEKNILGLHSANQIILFYLKQKRNDQISNDLFNLSGEIDAILHNIIDKYELKEKKNENPETNVDPINFKPFNKKNQELVKERITLPTLNNDANTNLNILNQITKNDVVPHFDGSNEENWEDVEISSEQDDVVQKLTKDDELAKMVNDLIYNPDGLSKIKKSITYNSLLRILNIYLTTDGENRNNLLPLVVEIDFFCTSIKLNEDEKGLYYLFDKDENINMRNVLDSSVKDLETADFYQDIKDDLLKLPKDIIKIEENKQNMEYYSLNTIEESTSSEDEVDQGVLSFVKTISSEEVVLPKNKSDLSYVNTTEEENVLPIKKESSDTFITIEEHIATDSSEEVVLPKNKSDLSYVNTTEEENVLLPIKKDTFTTIEEHTAIVSRSQTKNSVTVSEEEEISKPELVKKGTGSIYETAENEFDLPKNSGEKIDKKDILSDVIFKSLSNEEILPLDLIKNKKNTPEENLNPKITYDNKINNEFTKYNINRTQSSSEEELDETHEDLNIIDNPIKEKNDTNSLGESVDVLDEERNIEIKDPIVIPKKKKKLIRRIVVMETHSCKLCVNDIFLMQFVKSVKM